MTLMAITLFLVVFRLLGVLQERFFWVVRLLRESR
jgi:hypothetical protein